MGLKEINSNPMTNIKSVQVFNMRNWFKTPDIMAVHKCYSIAVPAIGGDDLPGIGGEGAGPIIEEPSINQDQVC